MNNDTEVQALQGMRLIMVLFAFSLIGLGFLIVGLLASPRFNSGPSLSNEEISKFAMGEQTANYWHAVTTTAGGHWRMDVCPGVYPELIHLSELKLTDRVLYLADYRVSACDFESTVEDDYVIFECDRASTAC